jgi:hypothetical protein
MWTDYRRVHERELSFLEPTGIKGPSEGILEPTWQLPGRRSHTFAA